MPSGRNNSNKMRLQFIVNDDSPTGSERNPGASSSEPTTTSSAQRRGGSPGESSAQPAAMTSAQRRGGSPGSSSANRSASSAISSAVTCEICGLTYSHRGNLSKHVSWAIHCLQRCSSWAVLTILIVTYSWNHLKMKTAHKNDRPHQCQYCKSCFHYPDGLRKHQKLLHSVSDVCHYFYSEN